MTEREALIRAVCAAPDDDLPRLVFADWLDENGEPERAEFIRVQCELRRTDAPVHHRVRLGRRESALLSAWEDRWRGELVSEQGLLWGWFERGFVERLSVYDGDPFFARHDDLFHHTPLRCLSVCGPLYLRRLIETPHFHRVQRFIIDPNAEITSDGVDALCAYAPAPHLRTLTVALPSVGAARDRLTAAYGDRFSVWGE